MKSLILYSTQSGNTHKLAKKIYDELEGQNEIFPIDEAPSADGYDLVAVGFWFQAGKPDPKSAEYLSQLNKNATVFLFATHGAAKDSDHVKNALKFAAGLTNGAKIIGEYTCQGEVNPKVLEKVKQKPTPPVWLNDADSAIGHPDEKDLEELKAIIKNI